MTEAILCFFMIEVLIVAIKVVSVLEGILSELQKVKP